MKSGRTAIPKLPHPVYNIRINGIVPDVRKQIGMEVFMNVEIDSEYRARWSELRPLLDAEIERNRKQNAVLRVTDRNGRPVPHARIRAVQKTHAFDFGCNVLWLGQKGRENALYEHLITELFNLVTTTFCLSDIQYEPGHWRFEEGVKEIFRRPPPDRVLRFAKANGLKLKGQPLMAGSWYPEWAKKQNLNPDGIWALYEDYFRRVAMRYGEMFEIYDLVNEAVCHTGFPLYTGKMEYVAKAFAIGKKYFSPKVNLELNEATPHVFNHPSSSGKNRFFNLISDTLALGQTPSSIGMQFHIWNEISELIHWKGAYTPLEIRNRLNEFSSFGLPLYISEITIPSVINGVQKEEIQAEIVEDFYRLFFSIASMRGILYWNLCDGPAWRMEGDCRGGLVDEFLRKKPAWHRLEHLIHREWSTALDGETSDAGEFRFRGYQGNYLFEIGEGSGTRRMSGTLSAEASAEFEIKEFEQ